jgi:hypothetical protein
MKAALVVVLAACGSTKPPEPVREMTIDEWVERCAARLEVGKLAVARMDKAFAKGKVTVDATPQHPHVRFHLDVAPDGYFNAKVQHGRAPCTLPDERLETSWEDGQEAKRLVLTRWRRLGDDEARIEGNRVSPSTAKAFRREMERAIDACLLDARGVTLAKGPDCHSM